MDDGWASYLGPGERVDRGSALEAAILGKVKNVHPSRFLWQAQYGVPTRVDPPPQSSVIHANP